MPIHTNSLDSSVFSKGVGVSFESEDQMFWWLIIGSKGGSTRAKMLQLICERPMNAHQLSEAMNVNYRTATFHLDVMLRNGLVMAEGPKYGLVYFPSPVCRAHKELLMTVIAEGPSAALFQENK
ncbi:MAG: winged helix-turn-helix transcriptional regulator [Nitrososphaerota archaeon]|nr:winged helix-turn-helix transcriptional regulator [Nitrososphaerota archaeon]